MASEGDIARGTKPPFEPGYGVSLLYFEDAEADPPLEMLTEISWAEVKDFFTRESAALM